MSERVDIPQFELIGTKCKHEDCDGVLTPYWHLKKAETGHQCSVCNDKFDVIKRDKESHKKELRLLFPQMIDKIDIK